MREHPKDVLVDKFQEAVMHVLEQRSGADLTLESADPNSLLQQLGHNTGRNAIVSACIELSGDELQSNLTVLAGPETMRQLAPHATASLVDWAGELANLLMGSIKNSLLQYGIDPWLGLPASKTGPDMRFLFDRSDYVVVTAETVAGTVCVALNFDLSSTESWEFDPQLAAADEGVVCFF